MTRAAVLADLAARIDALGRERPVRVGIDGVDAAGKTTWADELVRPLRERGRPCIRASVDAFHRPAAARYRRGRDSAEGYYFDSFDHEQLRACLLDPLGPGGSLRYRTAVFDHAADSPVEARDRTAPADAVLLFDGVFLHRPELRDTWDFSIFLRVDFETTLARAAARDAALLGGADAVRERYAVRYVPGQEIYLGEVEPERRASVVVDNTDPLAPVIARSP